MMSASVSLSSGRVAGSPLGALRGRDVCHNPALSTLLFLLILAPVLLSAQSRFIEQTRPMPMGRAFHGSAVLGDYLYVFGGGSSQTHQRADETPDTSVWKAHIQPSGHLGAWEQTTPLPGPRYYIANSTLVLNDVVYIIGGSMASLHGDRINTAIWSKPLADGTLTPWQQSAPFGEGLSTMAAVSTPGHLHIIGGLNKEDIPTREVWTNALFEDGSMSTWKPAPPLPMPLWFHAAGVVTGRVYTWGGIPHPDDGRPISSSNLIFSSPILGSGELGPWRQESIVLPVPFHQAPSAVAGPYLMSFCPPYPGGALSSDIWWTNVGPAGMSNWQRVPTTIPNRVYHAVAPDFRRGSIYVTGGRASRAEGMLGNAFYFKLSPQAREQAERAWMAAQRAHSNSVSAFTTAPRTTDVAGTTPAPTVLSYTAEGRLPAEAITGFLPYTRARRVAQEEGKPLVLYFNLRLVTPCQEQREILTSQEFQNLLPAAAFAWIDSSEQPQLAQQMGVYRVPTWIFFDAAGNAVGRYIGVMSLQDLTAWLQRL